MAGVWRGPQRLEDSLGILELPASQYGCRELNCDLLTTEASLQSLHAFLDVFYFPSLCHMKLLAMCLQLLLFYLCATIPA